MPTNASAPRSNDSTSAQATAPAASPETYVTPAAKTWAYPFALRDGTHPNDMISHFHALSAMEYGFFPIARSGYPNGSVHIGKQCISFTTEDGFRSMADGEVIAYRLDGILLPLRYSGQRMLRYSLGFVLVRHRLALPAVPVPAVAAVAGAAGIHASTSATPAPVVAHGAGDGIYIYSLYSYNKPLGRFPTDADGFLTVSLPFWKGSREYRVGLLAKDKQVHAPVRPTAHAHSGQAAPAQTRPAPLPALATGLRVRASGIGTAAIVGFLPRDCRLTLRVDAARGWAQIDAVTHGTPLSNVVGGEVSLTAINEGWVFVGELDSTPVPDPINTVVVLDTPYPVNAGDLLGFMGENPGASMALPEGSIHPDHPVVAIEVFAGDDFPAHLVESRRRAATLPDEEKTILVIERGAKLCSRLRPPTQTLPSGNRIVPGPGGSTKGRLVYGGRYSVTRQATSVPVPSTGKIGDYFKIDGVAPISEAIYNRLTSDEKTEYVEREALTRVGTQLYWAPKLQPSNHCISVWVDSPLAPEEADVVAAFQATLTTLDLNALDESRFIGGPDGVRWWNVQVGGAGNEAVYAWVCSENHPLTRWESPHAWPGFHIADGSAFTPLSAMQRIVTIHGTVHPEDEESFSPSVNVLGGSEMVVKLEEAIDHSGTLDGKVTAADIANARNTPWLARGLSRIIAKLESQWSGNIARWEAVTPFMNADWPTEMERQRLRGWWREVATKVPGFPQDPCVYHIHPFGWVANFVTELNGSELFERIVGVVLRHEGGFVVDPDDKGGATNMGISWPTWQKYALQDLGVAPTLTKLKELAIADAKVIYFKRYWQPRGLDLLSDARLALMIFDWTVNSGGAGREIQKMLRDKHGCNLVVDGVLGPVTILLLLGSGTPELLAEEIGVIRRAYYEKLAVDDPVNEKFINGWLARVADCENAPI